jgi:hypothetical protein
MTNRPLAGLKPPAQLADLARRAIACMEEGSTLSLELRERMRAAHINLDAGS